MILKVSSDMKILQPISYMNIADAFSQNEKNLEKSLSANIGNVIFPELFVFGNERNFQREADIFAIDQDGNLVVIELKVSGEYDRGKIYQALDYAQIFSNWQFEDMNAHYKKCYPKHSLDLSEAFQNHFGFNLDKHKFNRKQKIIVISNGSSIQTRAVSKYWSNKGIDIEEYYYRIYKIGDEKFFELSNELYVQQSTNHCWINTCEKWYPGAYLEMIKNQKASTYGDANWIINESMKSSYIFLYLNGKGIIASGIGTANIKTSPSNEKYDEERYVSLREFNHGVNIETGNIEKSISAAEIKELLKQDFWFATTRVCLSQENAEKLFKRSNELFTNSV